MSKVLILRGLPSSGKSTFARELVKSDTSWVRVNKDELRAQLLNGNWNRNKEKFIEKAEANLIKLALESGKSVVVDSTNLPARHETRINTIADEVRHSCGVAIDIEVKFFPIDPEEAIKRDLARTRSVGASVIWGMWNRFLKTTQVPKPGLNGEIVISDLDGTLALFGNKNPYNRDFENDEPNLPVIRTLELLDKPVIITSGRSDKFRTVSEEWVQKHLHNVSVIKILMRKSDDKRRDVVVKEEMYQTEINGVYDVFAVFDDRDQVVRLWRSLGLPCFQVAEGAF